MYHGHSTTSFTHLAEVQPLIMPSVDRGWLSSWYSHFSITSSRQNPRCTHPARHVLPAYRVPKISIDPTCLVIDSPLLGRQNKSLWPVLHSTPTPQNWSNTAWRLLSSSDKVWTDIRIRDHRLAPLFSHSIGEGK